MSRTILLLGGYGNAGARIARLLHRETDARLVLAGRSGVRASRAAERLNREDGGDRVSSLLVDAAEPRQLGQALEGVDLVVNAASTVSQTATVAQAALDAGSDWFDILPSHYKLDHLASIRESIVRAGRCFITEGGFHPGLPAVLVRFAATFLDRLQRATVGMAFGVDWAALEPSPGTLREFVEELAAHRSVLYDHGAWTHQPWWRSRRLDLGEPFGERVTVPAASAELEQLAQGHPSLVELGLWVAGFNWFVDWVGLGLGSVARRIFGRRAAGPVGRTIWWGLRRFSRPPWGAVILVEAGGWKKGRLVGVRGVVSHRDAYDLTAVPAAATILQYLDGSARQPGLWLQGLVVDPRRFMADLERLGAAVEYGLQVQTGRGQPAPASGGGD
jgi:saccharopine dehydrogenase (NAD+, L-lysine-forming)